LKCNILNKWPSHIANIKTACMIKGDVCSPNIIETDLYNGIFFKIFGQPVEN